MPENVPRRSSSTATMEPMPPSPRAATPQRVGGRYVVETVLGRGGMGAVYGVRDLASGHTRALKQLVLPADASRDDARAARLRFRREFHTMASLAHPRIVDVFDYGVDADTPYYTMELLDGEDLADVERIDPANACALLRDVASALAFLHARRLLHRDLAPRNVRCTSTGFAKLIDFGVLATTGACDDIAGTPPMIAPEAVRGRPATTSTGSARSRTASSPGSTPTPPARSRRSSSRGASPSRCRRRGCPPSPPRSTTSSWPCCPPIRSRARPARPR